MDNLLVISSEALFGRPHEVLPRVFRFVGVDDGVAVSDLAARNAGDSRTGIDPDVYAYLADYFRSPNQRLYDLIEQDFDW